MNELRLMKQRVAVLARKRQEVGLSLVEWTEVENLARLIVLAEAGYKPIGVTG